MKQGDYIKGMYETCIHAEECSKTTYGMNNDICQGCKTYSQKWPVKEYCEGHTGCKCSGCQELLKRMN